MSEITMWEIEDAQDCEIICGVDEAGCGPLCGPVCVAAVILNPDDPIEGVNDSKKLTEKKREALFDEIVEKALAYKIIFVGPDIIDRDNILNATMGGMKQAVEELDIVPNLVLVDGNRTPAGLQIPAQPVVKGDATSASIGAAAVTATCWSWTSSTPSTSWQSTKATRPSFTMNSSRSMASSRSTAAAF